MCSHPINTECSFLIKVQQTAPLLIKRQRYKINLQWIFHQMLKSVYFKSMSRFFRPEAFWTLEKNRYEGQITKAKPNVLIPNDFRLTQNFHLHISYLNP